MYINYKEQTARLYESMEIYISSAPSYFIRSTRLRKENETKYTKHSVIAKKSSVTILQRQKRFSILDSRNWDFRCAERRKRTTWMKEEEGRSVNVKGWRQADTFNLKIKLSYFWFVINETCLPATCFLHFYD